MTPQLLTYIRHLSKQDRKTLSQKALKTCEEVGDLAKVVLPYENAYATTHRFTERERILEESVDTILCALSVAYDIDFTDEEIESMMNLKTEKWAKLQSNEADLKYPLPFEIHITVKLPLVHNFEIEKFQETCKKINVKPIVLDLQGRSGNSVMDDVMTSSKHFGTNTSAYSEATRIRSELTNHGYDIIRVKIETVPWHPAAPQRCGDRMPQNCYFEAHVPVTIHPADEPAFRTRISQFRLQTHASRNTFKVLDDGRKVIMLTYRMYDDWAQQFQHNVKKLTEYIESIRCCEIGKVHTEFSIYDTKVSHDTSWINAQ